MPIRNLYKRRLIKELQLIDGVGPRPPHQPMGSDNSKAGFSVDIPVYNCCPTDVCENGCYGCQGRQMYPNAIRKTIAVDKAILEQPQLSALRVAGEAGGRFIRLAGVGELTPAHEPFIAELSRIGAKAYTMTRRRDSWLMYQRHKIFASFSLDGTTPESLVRWMLRVVPVRARAFMATPEFPTTEHEVAVVFPEHGSITRGAKSIAVTPLDCSAVRKTLEVAAGSPCDACRRCYGEDFVWPENNE